MRITLFSLLTLIQSFHTCGNIQMHIVSKCQSNLTEWKRDSRESKCKLEDGKVYHCMVTTQNEFAAFCYVPFSVRPKDGCPVLNTRSEKIQYVQCLGNVSTCPKEEDPSYTSYRNFKYPGCFVVPTMTPKSTATKQQASNRADDLGLERTTEMESEITFKGFIHSTKRVSISKLKTILMVTVESQMQIEVQDVLKEFQYISIGVGVGILVLVLLIFTAVIMCLVRKNRNYKKDVYFFKYGQNFDLKRSEEPTYDEIRGVETQVEEEEETGIRSGNTCDSLITSPYVSTAMNSFDGETPDGGIRIDNPEGLDDTDEKSPFVIDQGYSPYLSPVMQAKVMGYSINGSTSSEKSSIHSYIDVID